MTCGALPYLWKVPYEPMLYSNEELNTNGHAQIIWTQKE